MKPYFTLKEKFRAQENTKIGMIILIVMCMSLSAEAQIAPIEDSVIWATPATGVVLENGSSVNPVGANGGPTSDCELGVVREQSFSTTPPNVTGSGLSLVNTTNLDGQFSQSLLVRCGPTVAAGSRDCGVNTITFPSNVNVIGVVDVTSQLEVTDTTLGQTSIDYNGNARNVETNEQPTVLIDSSGTTTLQWSCEYLADTFIDEFRVLIDYGADFNQVTSFRITSEKGHSIRSGDRVFGSATLAGGVSGQIPLISGCGDGIVDRTTEQCDDGNNLAGDGCSRTCSFEDLDGDGVFDTLDPDPNDPCIPNNVNPRCDSDGDTVSDGNDQAPNDPCIPDVAALGTNDCDNDGLINHDEISSGTDILNPDTDNDGVNDGDEVSGNSDPLNPCDPDNNRPGCGGVDTDGDGINDGEETNRGTNPNDPCDPNPLAIASGDCDSDGLSNGDEGGAGTDPVDSDSDDDGINDGDEIQSGSNPLDTCDPNPLAELDGDCDGDGLTNGDEDSVHQTNPLLVDSDGDGINDGDEVAAGSDPRNSCDPLSNAPGCNSNADSDGDGISDTDEVNNGTDENDPCDPNPLAIATGDCDSDGLSNGDESNIHNTSPTNPDTDGDSIDDSIEVTNGNDPNNPCDPNMSTGVCDADNDGVTNDEESILGTDPNDADSDDDGLSDGTEVIGSTDPNDPDTNDDGICDGPVDVSPICTSGDDVDADGDGLTDAEENSGGSDPLNPCDPDPFAVPAGDCDADGLNNAAESTAGTDPMNRNTDGDALTDGAEVSGQSDPLNPCDPDSTFSTCDADQDGLTNAEEAELGTEPNISDTDGDGLSDGAEVNGGTDPLDACDPDSSQVGCNTPNPTTIDSDGDGVVEGEDPDDRDPCIPDPNSATCERCDSDSDCTDGSEGMCLETGVCQYSDVVRASDDDIAVVGSGLVHCASSEGNTFWMFAFILFAISLQQRRF